MKQSKLWYIRNFNFFSELTNEQRLFVCNNSVMKTFKKGQPVYFPQDESRTVFFLKDGIVKIFKVDGKGNEIITRFIRPGEIFGELAIMFEGKREDCAITEEDAIVCFMKQEDMNLLMEQSYSLAIKFAKLISQRGKQMEQRLIDLSFKDNRRRILDFVKDYANENGVKLTKGILIKAFPTHDDVAKFTSTSRQLVTTVLSALKKQEVIDYQKRKLVIKKPDEL